MNNKENAPAPSALAKWITPKLPDSLARKTFNPANSEQFQQALVSLHQKRDTAQNGYESIISSLKQIIEELMQRNEFLIQDRDVILKQNYELRKKNESLSNIIDVKRRLGESDVCETNEIFEIMVESGSVTNGMSKIEESCDEDGDMDVSNILSQNEHILNKQEFIIMSNPLSYNVSQIEENEISMSNIGRTQNIVQTRLQTPGLPRENIFIQCSTRKIEGVIRAFYLSIIQKKITNKTLVKLIEELKNDITISIYEPYPTNEFWTEMLCNFLKIIHEGHFDTQIEVLQYIKVHRLIDTLLINCLKSRVEFLFECRDSFEPPTVQEVLCSLSNQFSLRMQVFENQYVFFTKEVKEENLLHSERASLQISLNNKSQNKYYVKEEEPTFIIYEREEHLQLSFFIVLENEMGLSQYQINEEGVKNNQSFQYSDENERSMIEHDIEFAGNGDHLDNIASILNERDLNLDLGKDKKLTRNSGHRRYNNSNNKSPFVYQQPLSSSRFFLNRVSSKHSSLDENAYQ